MHQRRSTTSDTGGCPRSKLAGSAEEPPQTPFCSSPRGLAGACQLGLETDHDACLGPAKRALVEREQCPEDLIAEPSRSLVPVVDEPSPFAPPDLTNHDVRVGEAQAGELLVLDDPASAGYPGLGRERRRGSRGVISDGDVDLYPGSQAAPSIEVPAMEHLSNPTLSM